MTTVLIVLVVLALVATFGVLVFGLVAMARGGEFNQRYGNKLMRARVLLQGLALLLFAILMVLLGRT